MQCSTCLCEAAPVHKREVSEHFPCSACKAQQLRQLPRNELSEARRSTIHTKQCFNQRCEAGQGSRQRHGCERGIALLFVTLSLRPGNLEILENRRFARPKTLSASKPCMAMQTNQAHQDSRLCVGCVSARASPQAVQCDAQESRYRPHKPCTLTLSLSIQMCSCVRFQWCFLPALLHCAN